MKKGKTILYNKALFALSSFLLFAIYLVGCEVEDYPGHYPVYGNAIEAVRVCADGPTVDGIDVSHWQGNINWRAVKADGIEFAFMKATQGTNFIDSEFENNWIEAKEAGVLRGAYHFFCPNIDGSDQADHLLSVMGALEPGDLPPVLDVEWVPDSICPPCCSSGVSCTDMARRIRDWADRIISVTGRTPIIYTARSFWENEVCNSPDLNDVILWVANWGVTCPDIPSAWSDWVFWQTSDSGSVGGIDPVDTDVFNGDLAALHAFAGITTCGDSRCDTGETCISCPADCGPCPPDEEEGIEEEPEIEIVPEETIIEEIIEIVEPVDIAIDQEVTTPETFDWQSDETSAEGGSTGLESGCSCSFLLHDTTTSHRPQYHTGQQHLL